jgi:hypothetical protein
VDNHVHRPAQLGTSVLISGTWYYAYQTGYPVAADGILELAEAAERVLMRKEDNVINIEQK